MINKDILKNICDDVIEGVELTTKELYNCGLNFNDINNLIKKRYIIRVKRGLYSFKSFKAFFNYGKESLIKKDYKKAKSCFLKCFESDNSSISLCLMIFSISIELREYDEIFKYYDILSSFNNELYNNDLKFYLYVMKYYINIPKKYEEVLKRITINDIKISASDKRFSDVNAQNNVRILYYEGKFNVALKNLNDLIKKQGKMTINDFITKTLIVQARDEKINRTNKLVELVKNKDYDYIIRYLIMKDKHNYLVTKEEYIYKLAIQIKKIQETKQVPEIKKSCNTHLYDLIDNHNYNEALKCCNHHNVRNNVSNDDSIFNLLLSDICELIDDLSNDKSILDEDLIKLTKYMRSINKSVWEFLVLDLIKISLLNDDTTYSKAIRTLAYLSQDIFSFDINDYIKEFYISLYQGNIEEAKLYLDILSHAKEIGYDCKTLDTLYDMLEMPEITKTYHK